MNKAKHIQQEKLLLIAGSLSLKSGVVYNIPQIVPNMEVLMRMFVNFGISQVMRE